MGKTLNTALATFTMLLIAGLSFVMVANHATKAKELAEASIASTASGQMAQSSRKIEREAYILAESLREMEAMAE